MGFDRLGRACFGAAGGDSVIFVDVEPQTVLGRLAAREGNVSRLERRLSRETQRVELAAAGEALAEARSAVDAIATPESGVQVETLRNEDGEDLEATAADLARQVRAWSSTPGSR
jgi:dephospho-CoA kinase